MQKFMTVTKMNSGGALQLRRQRAPRHQGLTFPKQKHTQAQGQLAANQRQCRASTWVGRVPMAWDVRQQCHRKSMLHVAKWLRT